MWSQVRQRGFKILIPVTLVLGLIIFLVDLGPVIRNYGGDVVAVSFIFSCATLLSHKTWQIVLTTFGLALTVELIQALELLRSPTTLSNLTIGHTFDPFDIVVYATTTILLGLIHHHSKRNTTSANMTATLPSK